MELDSKILAVFQDEASNAVIDKICIGLGYTAVTLKDGRCGLCCTLLDGHSHCSVNKDPMDYEDRIALPLLQKLVSGSALSRIMSIALVNALNYSAAAACSNDPGDLLNDLSLKKGSKVAMVGHFDPVVKYLEREGVMVKSFDIGKHIGSSAEFYTWGRQEADALILTATSMITGTTEDVMEQFQGKKIPSVIMGPSTIMNSAIYSHLDVSVCAGTVPVDHEGILKAVRNGKGTPELHRYARKIRLLVSKYSVFH
jgi:uncharacterized protein